MIKKQIYEGSLRERLIASARDRLYSFSLADGMIRGNLLNGTRLINEMRANHDLGVLETMVLGRAYIGITSMAGNLKGNDRISLQIDCSGPIKGLLVEANAFGEVRGFLKKIPIRVDKPPASFDLSTFFGAGFLSVTRYLENAKHPFMGRIALMYGNIAKDLANYYLTSEQIPTAFNLSINFNQEGEVTGAGGLMLQAMPDASDRITERLEQTVTLLPSLGKAFARKENPEQMILALFQEFKPKLLANYRIEFMCHCNRERLENLLIMLPHDELEDIFEKGPFPVETRCHHCNTVYTFDRGDIQRILNAHHSKN